MEYTKLRFSGSTSGMGVLVTGTASVSADTIHTTAVSGSNYDEIWLYAQNNHTADVILTVEFGGAGVGNQIIKTITSKDGLVCIIPGFILTDGLSIKAFSVTGNVISISGFVNRITA